MKWTGSILVLGVALLASLMAVMPFETVGASVGHLLMGSDVVFFSVLGMVALAGVVANASLVMVLIPMAISLGPGLMFVGVFTLLLVPCLYVILDDLGVLWRLIHGERQPLREQS